MHFSVCPLPPKFVPTIPQFYFYIWPFPLKLDKLGREFSQGKVQESNFHQLQGAVVILVHLAEAGGEEEREGFYGESHGTTLFIESELLLNNCGLLPLFFHSYIVLPRF